MRRKTLTADDDEPRVAHDLALDGLAGCVRDHDALAQAQAEEDLADGIHPRVDRVERVRVHCRIDVALDSAAGSLAADAEEEKRASTGPNELI